MASEVPPPNRPSERASNIPLNPDSQQAAYEIVKAIRRILRKTSDSSRQMARRAGLSTPQMLCLRAIGEAETARQLTVAELAARVQLSIATVSRLLDRLESSGLVQRERSVSDRRKVYLFLTELGRQRLQQMPTSLHEQFLRRLADLPAARQQQVLENLQLIVELMGASDLDASPLLVSDDIKATPF